MLKSLSFSYWQTVENSSHVFCNWIVILNEDPVWLTLIWPSVKSRVRSKFIFCCQYENCNVIWIGCSCSYERKRHSNTFLKILNLRLDFNLAMQIRRLSIFSFFIVYQSNNVKTIAEKTQNLKSRKDSSYVDQTHIF